MAGPGGARGWLPAGAREWLRENAPGRIGRWLAGPNAAAAEPGEGAGAGTAPAHARDLALAPGMPVEVYLRTGERYPLSYLAKPLTDYFARSLREE